MRPNEWKGLPRPELSTCAETGNECHEGKCEVSSTHSEGEVVVIVTRGIDLAKNVFAIEEARRGGIELFVMPGVAAMFDATIARVEGALDAAAAARAPS